MLGRSLCLTSRGLLFCSIDSANTSAEQIITKPCVMCSAPEMQYELREIQFTEL